MSETTPSSAPEAEAPFGQELLAELLLDMGLATLEQLEAAREGLAALPPRPSLPMGQAFVPAGDGKSIVVVAPESGRVEATIALFAGDPGDGEFKARAGSRWTEGGILVVEDHETLTRRSLPALGAPRLGLIPTPQGSFLYLGEPPTHELSPQLSSLPSPFLAAPGAGGPLDLHASPGGELVVAANRGAGTVHVLLVQKLEQRGAVAVRAPGSAKGLGVAIAPDARTVYLTDGVTPRLAILDVATMRVRHQLLPTGPLGSMTMAPDGQGLLVCFQKGAHEMGLLSLSLPDLRVRHLMNLPGKGEGEHPGLPFQNWEDGPLALLVVHSYETRDPEYLLLVDRAKHRVVRNQALREAPLALAAPAPASWCPAPPDLGEVLVAQGWLAPEGLARARAALATHAAEGGLGALGLQGVEPQPSVVAQLPERLIRERGVLPLAQVQGALVVALANPRDPRARGFAEELAGGLALKVLPLGQAEFDAFMEERYPRLIEAHVVAMATSGPAPSPAPLPVAAAPPTAGEAAAMPSAQPGRPRPTPPRQAAAPLAHDDWAELPGERFLLTSPLKRQVAELDPQGRQAWFYAPEGETLARGAALFAHAARLPDGNTLVVDLGQHRILEVSPQRELVWASHEAARLKGPRHAIRLATGATLVADAGNHRIVELDPQGQVVWSYGEMGCSGNGLFKPASVAVAGAGRYLIADAGNHRVVEVDPAKGVVWQYGNPHNRLGGGQGHQANHLNDPSHALRLPNGHTLVVDAGNHRVLEIDLMGAVAWTYLPHTLKGGVGVKAPVLARRRANGNTIIAGRDAICEVSPELELQWEYHLTPPAGAKQGPGVQPLAPVAVLPAAPADAVVAVPPRVAAEADLPLGLPDRFLQVDRGAHRVFEVDRHAEVLWQYTGLGTAGHEEGALERPHHARRLRNGHTLITDAGHHRVLEIDLEARVCWQFGQRGRLGGGPKQLANPRSAERLTNGDTIIADQSNKRILAINMAGDVAWTFEGGHQRLQAPCYATILPDGHLLVVDWGGHVVTEYDARGKTVWSHGAFGRSGSEPGLLFHPEHASRLPNGHTLISDTQNHRVIEVDGSGQVLWQLGGGPELLPKVGRFGFQFLTPVQAWRLPNGHVVVFHAGKGHVVEVDRERRLQFQYTP